MTQSRGRVMLRWARRVILGVVGLVVAALCAGVAYEQWSRRQIAREFPPPGRLVEHGGRLSHLFCMGNGSPTVILEAGLDTDGSQTWAGVQPQIAAETRVCSYDRGGILWSEPRKEPRDANRIAGELHESTLLTPSSMLAIPTRSSKPLPWSIPGSRPDA